MQLQEDIAVQLLAVADQSLNTEARRWDRHSIFLLLPLSSVAAQANKVRIVKRVVVRVASRRSGMGCGLRAVKFGASLGLAQLGRWVEQRAKTVYLF